MHLFTNLGYKLHVFNHVFTVFSNKLISITEQALTICWAKYSVRISAKYLRSKISENDLSVAALSSKLLNCI